MFGTLSSGQILRLGVVALLAAVISCSNSKVPPKVELSEAKVTITDTRNATVSVNYKFIEGRPRAGQWYKLDAMFYGEGTSQGFSVYSGDASGLSAKGSFQKDWNNPPPYPAWKSGETLRYDITIYEGPSERSKLIGISNELKGEVKVP
jgi:hypothetical protein